MCANTLRPILALLEQACRLLVIEIYEGVCLVVL